MLLQQLFLLLLFVSGSLNNLLKNLPLGLLASSLRRGGVCWRESGIVITVMPKEGFEVPPLQNIEVQEAQWIRDMFLQLDVEGHAGDGRLPRHLAHSLMRSLGIQIMAEFLPSRVSLRDFLFYADAAMPEPTELEGYAKTVSLAISQNRDGTPGDITAKKLVDFQLSLNRVPPTESEANVYLSKMLDYDDCTETPSLAPERFQKELIRQARQAGIELEEEDHLLR